MNDVSDLLLSKINIYVPSDCENILLHDAQLFNIYKKNKHEINRNQFYLMLIEGYYEQYSKEQNEKYEKVKKLLSDNYLKEKEAGYAADEITRKVLMPAPEKQRNKNFWNEK